MLWIIGYFVLGAAVAVAANYYRGHAWDGETRTGMAISAVLLAPLMLVVVFAWMAADAGTRRNERRRIEDAERRLALANAERELRREGLIP